MDTENQQKLTDSVLSSLAKASLGLAWVTHAHIHLPESPELPDCGVGAFLKSVKQTTQNIYCLPSLKSVNSEDSVIQKAQLSPLHPCSLGKQVVETPASAVRGLD